MPLSSGSRCPRTVGLHDLEDEGTVILWDTGNYQAAHLDVQDAGNYQAAHLDVQDAGNYQEAHLDIQDAGNYQEAHLDIPDTGYYQAAHCDIPDNLTVNTTALRISDKVLMLHSMVIDWWYLWVCQHGIYQH